MNLLIKPYDGRETDVREFYENHGTFHDGDAGLDLFCLEDVTIPGRAFSVKVPLGVCMAAYTPRHTTWHDTTTGLRGGECSRIPAAFYLYPRSSTGSKTPIRLSNSVGVIDAGYRGQLIAIVDNVADSAFTLKKGERYFQVCAPDLRSIHFTLTDTLDDTSRGEGGFGSTTN